MSFKKSKLDLLVRVRYQNPLPSPPFPPKLLNIPTNPARYAKREFVAALANENPFPMVVDAECGMPLDLSRWECLWDGEGEDSALNPNPQSAPALDPKDAFLLGDPSTGTFAGSSSTPVPTTPHVAWLRKTEYISRESLNKTPATPDMRHMTDRTIDVSRTAQIRDIENSFTLCEQFDIDSLRHPNKPNVTAVESYEILPDTDVWANAYDLFKFSERPGDRPPTVYDPRLDCAILRPMESDGEHFLAYYLPKEDSFAAEFKSKRETNENADEDIVFSFVRDYETVKIEQDVPNEFLFVLDNGTEVSEDAEVRPRGAYYKNIERKIMLKKKRVNQWELNSYSEKWDAIDLTLAPFSIEELDEREEAMAEVSDPMYMFSRDADGEVDDLAPMEGVAAGDDGDDIA